MNLRLVTLFSLLGLAACQQKSTPQATAPAAAAPVAQAPAEKKYEYETVPGDSLRARIYTLDNGLKVYLTDYKDAPRIQTYIAVRAGSKNDPATATGLAHYLEHMVFKGTSKFGTLDYEKEKVELAKIENLYNVYRTKANPAERRKLYHQIDSISGVAAKYAIANEYDKMLGAINTRNSNAYTWLEQTVYTGDIPANQLERWAMIEGERFGELVPRIFHTELEAVYEEKNRSLDSDDNKVFETLFKELFPSHPYGTQTTIGTIEHLKNPSITEIKNYFTKYYVPNNIAVCLSGDLDFDKTIKLIDQYFGKLPQRPVPAFTSAQQPVITKPIVKTVLGPDAENVALGYRFPGTKSRDALVLQMISQILSNGQAGLIDLNLNQQQKVLSANATDLQAKDYSIAILQGQAREGQKLEQVKDLMLEQVEKVKKGDFPDWLIPAIIENRKISRQRAYENNSARADAFVSAFIYGFSWPEYVSREKEFASITKQEVMSSANKYLGDNYVAVYKRTGDDKNTQKVEKPVITPVPVNREAQSAFYKQVMGKESAPLKPQFLDYKRDIQETKLKSNVPLYSLQNKDNGLFNLFYVVDLGTNNDPKLGLAVQYLKFLGTEKYSAAALQQEFFKIGCSFDVFSSQDQVYVSLSGLDENLNRGLELFEDLLQHPKSDKKALTDMVAGILKERADAKLNKDVILRTALVNYAKYGPKNPFTNIVPEKELKKLKPEDMLPLIKGLTGYEHRVLYYGPRAQQQLVTTLNTSHVVPATLKPVPTHLVFQQNDIKDREVLWTNYDMVQAEIIFLTKSLQFDPKLVPSTRLFNEYFGGNMGSIVFQELRESRALAYSASSRYTVAGRKEESNYIQSYIGTQSDKLPEAMSGMQELLNDMPAAEANFTNAKAGIRNAIEAERITKSDVLFDYERAKKLGIDYDIRKDVYQNVDAMSFDDLKRFQQNYIKNQPQKILVIGSKDKLNFKELGKYGKVRQLTLRELFGY